MVKWTECTYSSTLVVLKKALVGFLHFIIHGHTSSTVVQVVPVPVVIQPPGLGSMYWHWCAVVLLSVP